MFEYIRKEGAALPLRRERRSIRVAFPMTVTQSVNKGVVPAVVVAD
jgi:hypothetical protein